MKIGFELLTSLKVDQVYRAAYSGEERLSHDVGRISVLS